MQRNKLFKYIAFLPVMIALIFAGCTDDLLDGPNPGGFPEGETTIKALVDFEPMAQKATRAISGSQIKMGEMDDLCVVMYDAQGNLMEGFPQEITDYKESLVDRVDDNASNGHTAESKTKRAEFTMKVPYGRYYIYALSNLGRYQGNTRVSSTLSELQGMMDQIKTRDGLLTIQRQWDEQNYLNNREMMGYFTDNVEKRQPSTSKGYNHVYVDIDRSGMSLHSWLRRCAAKVTVDFDGSKLRDNIKIYIRRASLHDIPTYCRLGEKSCANEQNPIITYKDNDYRPNGEQLQSVEFGSGTEYQSWPYIANGRPKIVDNNNNVIDYHSEDKPAMWLYENMQDESPENKGNDKTQVADKDGLVVGANDKKDEVAYGSYIEVEGYYDMSSNEQVSQGKIYYRFMLGKDIVKNFDVERNTHYKVTMCPRGNGNDVDWHIEYNTKKKFETRNPYYVSYLYNHDSTLRFRYTPDNGQEIESVDAEIVGNNWWPDGYSPAETGDNTWFQTVIDEQNPVSSGNPYVNPNEAEFDNHKYDSGDLKGKTKYLGNGFLSLYETTETSITPKMTNFTSEKGADFYGGTGTDAQNDYYFYGFGTDNHKIDRSKRTYKFSGGNMDGTMKPEANGAIVFNIPVWSRAKNIIKWSGHTGNNLYAGHTRSAFVKLTVNFKGGGSDSEIVHVEQVKRIVNPKAIYRRSGNNQNFHVVLKELNKESDTDFVDVESDGPWMAEVLGSDQNFINLNGRQTIKGNSNTPIDFNIRFNKMNIDNTVRNAIIRIRYNNYSCVHLIFVRQGYAPQAIGDDAKTLWHTTNLIIDGVEALDPRDEGSMFKFGIIDKAFDVASNIGFDYSKTPAPGDFWKMAVSQTKLYEAKADRTKGAEIKWDYMSSGGTGNPFDASSSVATMEEFKELFTYKENNPINQGFGVLYADGAIETATNKKDAYGWYRYDDPSERDKRGMRGVIVYSTNTYKSVFFPIGISGYGHRKDTDEWGGYNSPGRLRYSCGQTDFFHTKNGITWLKPAPLFYENFRKEGAVYYSRDYRKDAIVGSDNNSEAGAIGLDINYFSFDFNLISAVNLGYGKDACFLRRTGAVATTKKRRR